MAAPYNPPKKNEDFKIRIMLRDATDSRRFKAAPTIAAGDFKVDIDGGGFTNLATLPSVSPAAGRAVVIELSATEMNGDVITVQCVDQTDPPEWCDYSFSIPTTQ
jgi:hypothetical protein